MPQVKDLSFSASFVPRGGVVARVEYDIEFFTKEIEPNIAFREAVAVIDQNAMLDHWLPRGADLRQIPPERDEADGLVSMSSMAQSPRTAPCSSTATGKRASVSHGSVVSPVLDLSACVQSST